MDLSNPGHESDGTEGKREMADTPVSAPRPNHTISKRRYRKAVRLGYLLVLKELRFLSEGQVTTMMEFQARLNLDEVLSAQELFISLMNSPRAFARARQDLKQVLVECPAVPLKSNRPEIRRIGVGYRDKGALRPSHKPRPVTRVIWSEDIPVGSRSPWADSEDNPRWISADELFEDERSYGPEMRFYYRTSVSTGMEREIRQLAYRESQGFLETEVVPRSGPEMGDWRRNSSDSKQTSEPNPHSEESTE